MLGDPQKAGPIPRPADRSANKPIYIIRAEDPEEKTKIVYFASKKLNREVTHLTLSGLKLTKAQATKLRQNPNALENSGDGKEVNVEIPWHRVISTENITYKQKAQQEK